MAALAGEDLDDAHAACLQVHPCTSRAENTFPPAELRTGDGQSEDLDGFGRVLEEERLFRDTGVGAMFADQSDVAMVSRALVEDADRR